MRQYCYSKIWIVRQLATDLLCLLPSLVNNTSDNIEDGNDRLDEGRGQLRARAVAQLQLGQVAQSRHGRQHHEAQLTVVETKKYVLNFIVWKMYTCTCLNFVF